MTQTEGNLRHLSTTGLLMFTLIFLAGVASVQDVHLYAQYAKTFLLHGSLPVQYPPLSVLPMVVAYLISRAMHMNYVYAWYLLTTAALLLQVWRIKTPLMLLAFLLLASPLLGTYDLLPITALVFSYLTLDTHPRLSWFLLGVAIALKLFPILVIPLWWQRGRKGWAYGLMPLLTFWPPAMWSVVHYQFARQAEWESTVALLSSILSPQTMILKQGFGSVEFFNAWSGTISLALDALYLVAFYWITFVRREIPLIARMFVLLSLWFLSNKVLSVQYAFWVVTFGFLFIQGKMRWWLVLLGWTTGLLYPVFADVASRVEAALLAHGSHFPIMAIAMLLVGLRLLVWLTVIYLVLRQSTGHAEHLPIGPPRHDLIPDHG